MKNIVTILLVALVANVYAQKADSVFTHGGEFEVYYSFENGEEKVLMSNWDIGFNTSSFDASIIINEKSGVKLYVYGADTTKWNTADTTGFAWDNTNNSEETWSGGAFANLGTSHPDYGWGNYTSGNHYIYGSKIFIIKLSDGAYKQIVISEMSAVGVFSVKVGDVGGANTSVFTLDKAGYTSKNFVMYNLVTNKVVDEEPAKTSWDLLFTKYVTEIQAGPDVLEYTVAGIKVNKGFEVAERAGVATSSNDTSSLTWSSKITEIGSDWKKFDNTTYTYSVTSDLTYFVRSTTGAVWKIFFTKYAGGALGGYYFNIERIVGGASVSSRKELISKVYPNPANGAINIENSENRNATIALLDVQGKEVYRSEVLALATKQISTTDLPSGVYTLVLVSQDASSIKRVIIE